MRKVLLLGSSGEIAPNIIPALGQYYDLRLADLKPHPDGLPTRTVDITDYKQVLEAVQGVEAIANFTVNRPHPVLSFAVSTTGAFNVMKAAAEVGIKKVLHTGPELVISDYGHEFDIGEVPQRPGSGYYSLTKMLGMEICRAYARTHGIQTICYQFNGLGPKPERAVQVQDFPPFTITWEDLVQACRRSRWSGTTGGRLCAIGHERRTNTTASGHDLLYCPEPVSRRICVEAQAPNLVRISA